MACAKAAECYSLSHYNEQANRIDNLIEIQKEITFLIELVKSRRALVLEKRKALKIKVDAIWNSFYLILSFSVPILIVFSYFHYNLKKFTLTNQLLFTPIISLTVWIAVRFENGKQWEMALTTFDLKMEKLDKKIFNLVNKRIDNLMSGLLKNIEEETTV
ncbi:hypothetical protein HDU92_000477 [Lobulomyces angularis]|nr:hypothetical protein HDU92_000477 [Lobulomyces angularis]